MSSLVNSTADYSTPDGTNAVAALLIFLVGVFGAVCNFSIMAIFVIDSERTSFQLICFSRAVINFYILVTTFLGLFLPSTILGHSMYSEVFETWNMNLSMSLYVGNQYQIALVAINRFSALFFPRSYSKIFAIRPTLAILVTFYGYRIVNIVYYVAVGVAHGCFYSFSPVKLAWSYPPDPTCFTEDNILYFILTTLISCTCLNIITFVRIIKFYLSMQNLDKETQIRIKKNAWLFFQTVLQDSLYVVDVVFTHKLSPLSTNRFWTFVSGTLVWESLHSIDGFIMLVFNDRIALLLGRRLFPPPELIVIRVKSPVHAMASVG